MIRWYLGTSVVASGYAWLLHRFQRAAPQAHLRWIWAEVVGGVMLVMGMAAWTARRREIQTWREYERLVASLFVAAGIPIVIWQHLVATNDPDAFIGMAGRSSLVVD